MSGGHMFVRTVSWDCSDPSTNLIYILVFFSTAPRIMVFAADTMRISL